MTDADQQGILIPELNIKATDAQLKNLQKQMLADHYSNQMKNSRHQKQNPQQQPALDYRILNKLQTDYDKEIRIDLASTYKEQMQAKQKLKKIQRQRAIKEEQEGLKRVQYMYREEMEKNKLLNELQKKQALEVIAKKQKQKLDEKHKLEEEKRLYRQRYSTNILQANKQKSFQDVKISLFQHFQNVTGVQNELEKNYLKNVLPLNQRREEEKDKITNNGIKRNQYQLRQVVERQQSNNERYRNELKEALQIQIREKEEKKRKQVETIKGETYSSQAYTNKYHPINNPVDFKITRDNKYVINELKKNGMRMSGLARSGSHALIS